MEEYISKSVFSKEIEKCYNECLKRSKITDVDYWYAKSIAYRNVLEILNDTPEVKEVDLEKEYKDFIKSDNGRSMFETAKYFFELGLKAQKGE